MRKLASLLAIGGLLVVAAPASAQQSLADGYGGKGNSDSQVLGEIDQVDAPAAKPAQQAVAPTTGTVTPPVQQTENTSGTLPFTGLDVALIALGGVFLVGVGLVVRRVSRDPLDIA
jgi:hypothetical protein